MNVEKLCKSSRSEELMLPTYINIERVRTSIAYLNSVVYRHLQMQWLVQVLGTELTPKCANLMQVTVLSW